MKDGEKRYWHVKFCISAGQKDDWAMYIAPGEWDDARVAQWGDKITKDLAIALVKLMDLRVEFRDESPIDVLQREWRD